MLSSSTFKAFKFYLYCELIHVQNEKEESSFILLTISIQAVFGERFPFLSSACFLRPVLRVRLFQFGGFIFWQSVLSYCYMFLLCCLFVVALGATALISFNKLELQLSGCQGLVSVFTGSSVGPEEQQQLACDRAPHDGSDTTHSALAHDWAVRVVRCLLPELRVRRCFLA